MLKQQAIFTAQPWLAKVGPSQSHPPNPDSQERVPPRARPQVKTRPEA
jgi:hypothetical protein